MEFEQWLEKQAAWLRSGGLESDIVLSSRIRLARNFAGYPFISRMPEQDRKNIIRSVGEVAEKILEPETWFYLDMTKISEIDRRSLLERQLISRPFAEDTRARAVLLDQHEDFSVMVNEEDHLRIQAVGHGFDFAPLWERVNRLDDQIEREIPYAFDDRLGYLTACPSNIGTGIRASVMVHIPGLLETGEMERLFRSLQKMNLAVRGIYGEGSPMLGEFYQISNQATLGLGEEDIINRLAEVVPRIIAYERQARQHLRENDAEPLLDRCFRALGLLSNARKIELEEAMGHLSSLRLGFYLGLQTEVDIATINELLLRIQPGHLRKMAGRELTDATKPVFRAEFLRKRLAGKS